MKSYGMMLIIISLIPSNSDRIKSSTRESDGVGRIFHPRVLLTAGAVPSASWRRALLLLYIWRRLGAHL